MNALAAVKAALRLRSEAPRLSIFCVQLPGLGLPKSDSGTNRGVTEATQSNFRQFSIWSEAASGD